ncbi:MAG: hypothetical protein QNJ91_03385 [Gammaproteobacteria bacterium]|nr:hypothetical protein [Gammaproteobacteria bacterium]
MADKLIQKHWLHGTQEFEIVDDLLRVTTSGPLKGRKVLDFVLATLNPDPVLNNGRLDFYGRVKCGPMLSLFVDRPDPASFDAFVDTLKTKVREEYGAFTGDQDLGDR